MIHLADELITENLVLLFPRRAQEHQRCAHHRQLLANIIHTNIDLYGDRVQVRPLGGSGASRWWVNVFIIIIHSRPLHSILGRCLTFPLLITSPFSPDTDDDVTRLTRVTCNKPGPLSAHCLWVYNETYSGITSLPRLGYPGPWCSHCIIFAKTQ